MSISVIVPSCGRPSLEYTVASILPQLGEDDELIVVGPRKPEVIKPRYDYRDDFVWVEHQNGGCDPVTRKTLSTESGYPSGGLERDLGKAVAKGTHLMCIDDDDIFMPTALSMARQAIESAPDVPHVFRMQYGCKGQWHSEFALEIPPGVWRGVDEPSTFVLWGRSPAVEIGNVGGSMYVLPNHPSVKWDCSAPGGIKNQSEDFWVLYNLLVTLKCRPVFHKEVNSIIKPSAQQLADVLKIPKPTDVRYAPQPGWDGVPQ